MYKSKESFYIIPKVEFDYSVKNLKNFYKDYDDYKIKECTEAKISEMIDNYNLEQDIKYFNRKKTEDFYFVRATEIEIGKYKSGKIEILDMWKK